MNVPKLRFPEFNNFEWQQKKLDSVLNKVSDPVKVEPEKTYREIGIRSHGKGIFHKDNILGNKLGDKRVFWVKPNALVLNIVFAWEQALGVTSNDEIGLIASHRFPMYLPKDNLSSTQFLKFLFLTKKGKTYLELASPGGAGRNKTLGQKNFDELNLVIPELEEQTKIANFLTAADEKIAQLSRKCELLAQYKKGVMQQIFSQQLRFKPALSEVEGDDDGKDFPEWEEKSLEEVFQVTRGSVLSMTLVSDKQSNENPYPVFSSQTKNNGLSGFYSDFLYENCITWTTDGANAGDVNFRNGKFYCTNVCGVLKSDKGFANACIASMINTISKNYVSYVGNPKLMNNVMAKIRIKFPCLSEQTKIANFLTAIDDKISHAQAQLAAVKQYKQGLLQQLFV